jgi:phage terminase large subunit-like protein
MTTKISKTTRLSYAQRATDYCRRVVAGEVLASKWIKLACKRHLDDLQKAHSRWHFDPKRANRVCAYIESHPHEKGAKQGQPFLLEDWQVWVVSSIFGWVDDEGTRKYREAILLVPRGQGKSPLAALIALWMTFFDGEPGAETLTAATTEKQAKEIFGPAQFFVREVPAYKRLGIEAAAKSIYQTSTRAKFHAVIGKAKYGSAPHCCCMDEAHQLPDSQQYDNFRTGLAKRRNSLLLTVTTAGIAAAENPAYQLQLDAQKILEGSVENDRFFAAIYCADPEVDWTSLEALQMACPNLGISIDTEALQLDQKEAVRNPARQNAFRAMHLNQWMTGSSSWLNMQTFNACADQALKIEDFADDSCWLGLDTASHLDLASVGIVFKRLIDGKVHYYCFSRNYLPEAQVNQPENQHYQRWAREGHLFATDGNSIDFGLIESDLIDLVKNLKVEMLCFDPAHGGTGTVQRVMAETDVPVQETPQRALTISPAMRELEAAIADGRFHFTGDPVMRWCFSNIVTRETVNGLYKMPEKQRPENKIDAAMAIFFAVGRALLIPIEDTWAFDPFTV